MLDESICVSIPTMPCNIRSARVWACRSKIKPDNLPWVMPWVAANKHRGKCAIQKSILGTWIIFKLFWGCRRGNFLQLLSVPSGVRCAPVLRACPPMAGRFAPSPSGTAAIQRMNFLQQDIITIYLPRFFATTPIKGPKGIMLLARITPG